MALSGLQKKSKTNTKASHVAKPTNIPAEVPTLAEQYRLVIERFEEVEAEKAMVRDSILEQMTPYMLGQLAKGDASTTVEIPLSGNHKCQVIMMKKWNEPFEASAKNADLLESAFGEDWELYVNRSRKVSLKPGIDVEAIRAAAGKNADAVMALFKVDEAFAPRENAYEVAAELSRKGDSRASDLVEFIEGCTPQFAVKVS